MDKRTETFILLLGSDQPGEVTTAASMLVKALKKEGKDLHDMVKAMNGISPQPNYELSGALARSKAENQNLRNQLTLERDARQQAQGMISGLQQQIAILQNAVNRMGPSATGQTTYDQVRQAYDGFQYTNQDISNLNKWARGFANQQRAYQPHDTGSDDWCAKAEWALSYGWSNKLINEWEYDFLQDMVSRSRGYSASYKQISKIEDIYERLKRVEASRDR